MTTNQTSTRTEDVIAGYIAENILFSRSGYPYAAEESFLENGIIDSVNVLELVMFIEETFHVHVEDGEIVPENFDSVSRLAAFVAKKLGEK
jgi:acyl carrier protein